MSRALTLSLITLALGVITPVSFAQTQAAVAGGTASTVEQKDPKNACAPAQATPAGPKVWSANVAIGYAKTGGNAETESFTPAINIQRAKGGGRWLLGMKGAYGKFKSTTTQDIGMAALVYREDFDPSAQKFGDGRFYWGAGALGFYDQIAGTDHRYAGVAGIGAHAIKSEMFNSDFEVSPGYRNEKEDFSGSRSYSIWRVANYSGLALSPTAGFVMDTDFSGSINEPENWVLAIDPGLQVMLNQVVMIKVGGWWRKENEPVPGAKEEDWVWGTQFGVQF